MNHRTIWYREPYVWMIIGIPLTSVVVGFALLYAAVESNDGLVADDYYRRGLEINRVLDRDHAAARLGLSGDLRVDPERGTVITTLGFGHDFRPPETLHLALFYATRSGLDRTVLLQRVSADGYAGRLPPLVSGHWYVQLEAGDWRLTGSTRLPAGTRVHLAPGAGG